MNRRESLKILGLTTLSTAVLLDACKPGTDRTTTAETAAAEPGRQEFELERDKKLQAEKFFSAHEMGTITVLANIIIPKDEHSGSASDAKVPEFIEFMVKDIPSHQIPMRGGLRWLDMQCLKRFQKPFKDTSAEQQLQMVDLIAYPKKAKPGMEQGVAFFNLMRSLTASGFFTSEMGVKDLGYAGNVPNKWQGVPADVLKQYETEIGGIS
ncbi:gluconate 2-dehydrogenase subunit 3 family protein [Pedobacter heparinus]|uniref:gluconate 2-dehydrogenase subunit 3 family protein n=1 Tax=Pedobacter heparinus TaxID=984 RepID=UPI00292CD1CE|nr:gluconate 2-dehydrogenase subunit 3 family protein [Pedobacter heparinus]